EFARLRARGSVWRVRAPFANRLHFGAEQHEARLERFEQMVVVVRLPVLGDVRLRQLALGFFFHIQRGPEGPHYDYRLQACRASRAASNTAAIMLCGSAIPFPAMSNAVP